MAKTSITTTRNYSLFDHADDNRVTDIAKHKKLAASMKKYGFLECYPVVVRRDSKTKRLVIVDGQHRFELAESLGLPVSYIETSVEFDIAEINTTSVTWAARDYAEMYAKNGVESYVEGLQFCEQHGLPIGISFAILGGTSSFTNVRSAFQQGRYAITDRPYADAVAATYGPMSMLSADVANSRFLQACMYVCRVEGFEIQRLIQNAKRCRDKLLSYSTRDAYLDMLDEIYNFGRAKLFPLKMNAVMTMRDRNVVSKTSKP